MSVNITGSLSVNEVYSNMARLLETTKHEMSFYPKENTLLHKRNILALHLICNIIMITISTFNCTFLLSKAVILLTFAVLIWNIIKCCIMIDSLNTFYKIRGLKTTLVINSVIALIFTSIYTCIGLCNSFTKTTLSGLTVIIIWGVLGLLATLLIITVISLFAEIHINRQIDSTKLLEIPNTNIAIIHTKDRDIEVNLSEQSIICTKDAICILNSKSYADEAIYLTELDLGFYIRIGNTKYSKSYFEAIASSLNNA